MGQMQRHTQHSYYPQSAPRLEGEPAVDGGHGGKNRAREALNPAGMLQKLLSGETPEPVI